MMEHLQALILKFIPRKPDRKDGKKMPAKKSKFAKKAAPKKVKTKRK